MINSLYIFWAPVCSSSGGTVYTTISIFCACYVSWLLAGLEWNQYTNGCICSASWWWANRCLKNVEAINRNKLKANSASCWSVTLTYSVTCFQSVIPTHFRPIDHRYSYIYVYWTLHCSLFVKWLDLMLANILQTARICDCYILYLKKELDHM
jgi:hypothetical protein